MVSLPDSITKMKRSQVEKEGITYLTPLLLRTVHRRKNCTTLAGAAHRMSVQILTTAHINVFLTRFTEIFWVSFAHLLLRVLKYINPEKENPTDSVSHRRDRRWKMVCLRELFDDVPQNSSAR